jgi:aromatic ring-opening dioxygenase catalytic subunit (LigB family)
MSLVFAGVCSHGPGITARSDWADPQKNQRLDAAYDRMRQALVASRPDALVVIAAEHFANFFMNNMPAFAVGMADYYEGPVENPDWLKIPRRRIPGQRELSLRLIENIMQHVDISYCEEWKFDHGIMVPLHHLTPDYDLPVIPVNINCQSPPMAPLHRAYALGQAIRFASDRVDARIAVVGTGGISHWPCTPDSGKINEPWDRVFLDRWCRNDRQAMTSYSDDETYLDAGQGGFEIRTYIAVAGAAEHAQGELWCYEPIPDFSCGCTIGVLKLPG